MSHPEKKKIQQQNTKTLMSLIPGNFIISYTCF